MPRGGSKIWVTAFDVCRFSYQPRQATSTVFGLCIRAPAVCSQGFFVFRRGVGFDSSGGFGQAPFFILLGNGEAFQAGEVDFDPGSHSGTESGGFDELPFDAFRFSSGDGFIYRCKVV